MRLNHFAQMAGAVHIVGRRIIAKGLVAVMIGKLPAVRIGVGCCGRDLPAAIPMRADTTVLTGG